MGVRQIFFWINKEIEALGVYGTQQNLKVSKWWHLISDPSILAGPLGSSRAKKGSDHKAMLCGLERSQSPRVDTIEGPGREGARGVSSVVAGSG